MKRPLPTVPLPDELDPVPLMAGHPDDEEITRTLFDPVWRPTSRGWLTLLALASGGFLLLIVAIGVTVFVGVGTWGINIPVAWAFAITNFVWWIGIGHAEIGRAHV